MINPSTSATALTALADLQKLLGHEAVFLPVKSGTKACSLSQWPKITLAKTQEPSFVSKLLEGNIAVSLGTPSAGLCSLDFDDEDAGQKFLEKNPSLQTSLRTKGGRGFNVWVKITGEFPGPAKLMSRATGTPVGEWRATGNYTVIHGKHPSGSDYKRIVDAPPLEISFGDIMWPSDIAAPKSAKPLAPSVGRPLSESLLESRKKIASSILDDVIWSDNVTGFCTCPGKEKHTGSDGPKDCMVSLDGVPTVYCFHTSCSEEVERMNKDLRQHIRSQEVILLPDGYAKMKDASEQLFEVLKSTKKYYVRGQAVCEIVATDSGNVFRPVDKVRAAASWEDHTQFGNQTFKDGEPKVTLTELDESKAARFLATDAVKILPKVEGIVTCPVLYKDSTTASLLIHDNGYNFDTKLFVSNPTGEKLPMVGLNEAVEAIRDLVEDFDFESQSHRSRAIMSFITPALVFSGLLGGRPPMDVAEADSSQAGKGFRQKLICAIYNETPSMVAQRKGGVGGLDESFQEALIRGRPFIVIDNVRGSLDSPYMESFATASGLIGARGFGQKEVEINVSRFNLMLSSNDLKFTEDMANRSSVIRIRKRSDGYEWKRYGPKKVFVDQWLAENQRFYLACVFRIVQEWYRRGCPELPHQGHDFRWWAGKGEYIVQEMFGEAPMLDGHRSIQQRAGDPRLGWLQKISVEVERVTRVGEPLKMSDILDICDAAGFEPYRKPGEHARLFNNLTEELSYLGGIFGRLFKREKGVVNLDGFAVKHGEVKVRRSANDGDFIVSTYTFQRMSSVTARPQPPPNSGGTPLKQTAEASNAFEPLHLGIDDLSPIGGQVGVDRVSQPADISFVVSGQN